MTGPILHPGDKVALVCASSTVPEERLEPAVAAVEALGLRSVVYPTCYHQNRHGNFAALDTQRAKDLTDAFLDDTVRGVLSIRGGYGAGRLLPMLDWDMILQKPKFFSGYSDVTALHLPLNNAGWVTYHTIMPSTEYYKEVDGYSLSALDVSIRAQVLNLMSKLQQERGLTYLFIAHDLSVVRFISDRIGVIYKGQLMELAESEQLFAHPLHPYTNALLSAIPMPDPLREKQKKLVVYDPACHQYEKDPPTWAELEPGHFVLANQREQDEYRRRLEG